VKKTQNDKLRQIENDYRELVGMDEASLLQEMEEAEREWEEEQKTHPEESKRQSQEADRDFEILMARIKAEEKRPVSIREYNHRIKWENRDVTGKRKNLKKAAVVAAVLGALMIGGGISSVARNGYKYMVYPGQKSENIEMRYNTEIEFIHDELDKAYDQVSQCLGIKGLMLHYMPDKMEFQGVKRADRYIILQFAYEGRYFYLREEKLLKNDVIGLIASDRQGCQTIYNEWIDENLQLEENELENGIIEYSVVLEKDEAYYYLCGVMEREEFIKIVENLVYY
jgi:hypothetical protein